MRVLVTGAEGQLGRDICLTLAKRNVEYKGTTRNDFDITNSASVISNIKSFKPDAVIHCAAYTSVDKAEEEIEYCFAVNVGGTENVVRACQIVGAKMIYISSDYVFSGKGDYYYNTNDPTEPINIYGKSKLDGENVVKSLLCRYFIIRTSWVFGKNGRNFIKAILERAKKDKEIKVVCDQIGSPTYTVDLSELLCEMVDTDEYGIYHVTNEGICSCGRVCS